METIDGWEVKDLTAISEMAVLHLSDDGTYLDFGIRMETYRGASIPVAVIRQLLGDRSADPQGDADAATMTSEEGSEIMSDLLGAIAALTGTAIEDNGPSVEAWSQARCAEVGQVEPGALPWRPAVGEECFLFASGEWRLVERIKDEFNGVQRYQSLTATHAAVTWFEAADYDGIRPLGSLPVPASVRAKAGGADEGGKSK